MIEIARNAIPTAKAVERGGHTENPLGAPPEEGIALHPT